MTDHLDKAKRSWNMSRIRGENTAKTGERPVFCSVSHETEIMMEILKHGSHVEVLEPEWLREKVVAELKAAVSRYK